jgi:hypothetical protein
VVSSMGANPQSRAFYLRVKGEMEAAVKDPGYTSIGIFRPSLIAGGRRESRLGERVALWLARLVSPLLVGLVKEIPAQLSHHDRSSDAPPCLPPSGRKCSHSIVRNTRGSAIEKAGRYFLLVGPAIKRARVHSDSQ